MNLKIFRKRCKTSASIPTKGTGPSIGIEIFHKKTGFILAFLHEDHAIRTDSKMSMTGTGYPFRCQQRTYRTLTIIDHDEIISRTVIFYKRYFQCYAIQCQK